MDIKVRKHNGQNGYFVATQYCKNQLTASTLTSLLVTLSLTYNNFILFKITTKIVRPMKEKQFYEKKTFHCNRGALISAKKYNQPFSRFELDPYCNCRKKLENKHIGVQQKATFS